MYAPSRKPYASPFASPYARLRPSRVLEVSRFVLDILIFLAVALAALLEVPARLLPTSSTASLHLGFHCDDASLQLPALEPGANSLHIDRTQLAVLALLLPLGVVVVGELLRNAVRNRRVLVLGLRLPSFVVEGYRLVGVYLFVLALLQVALALTQRLVGRLRPAFRALCRPLLADGSPACGDDAASARFVAQFRCSTAAAQESDEAWGRSFPSSTAALAWLSMGFVALYLQARLRAPACRTLRLALQLGFVALAVLASCEGVAWHRHHWGDVVAGALMGVASALFGGWTIAGLHRPPGGARATGDDGGSGRGSGAAHRIYSDPYGVYGVLPRRSRY